VATSVCSVLRPLSQKKSKGGSRSCDARAVESGMPAGMRPRQCPRLQPVVRHDLLSSRQCSSMFVLPSFEGSLPGLQPLDPPHLAAAMTNVDGRAATAERAPGTARLPKIGSVTGRWSDVMLGITWKEARRPVFKPSQSDDGRRKMLTVERLYQGAPASNSKIIRAGDKLLAIDADGSSKDMIGSSVSDMVRMMEQLGTLSHKYSLKKIDLVNILGQ